jgi:outer membrane protein assembly factor BamD (BamD/ComL family)
MADLGEASDNQVPFEEHRIYREAMEEVAKGDDEAAAAKLQELVEVYPEEQALRDLLMRVELRATVAVPDRLPTVHRKPAAALRMLVLVCLVIAVCLIGTGVFIAAYEGLVAPANERQQEEISLDLLRQDGQARFEAGDCAGAEEVFGELLTMVPADPTAETAIQFCEQQEVLARLYGDAADAEQSGNVDTALGLYRQIEEQNPEYRDVPQRIEDLEEQVALEALWQQANDHVQAGNWSGAVDGLAQIRTRNSEFRRKEVEDQLYQAYAQLGQQLLSQARGSLDTVREAIGYLGKALAMRPMQDDLMEQLWLATGFVSGTEAAAQEDWEDAVLRWQPVYEAQPHYQDGVLEKSLYEAYPKAAGQLIARAKGVASLIGRAMGYLERALAREPDNQVWREERRLAIEYLVGAEAFAEENWETAIARWGGIYTSYPDYQSGVLEEKLREACDKSPEPDLERCPQ